MARPRTKAPETQIYFITHRSGANSVLRTPPLARGERASRSIVNRTTALWSIWMVASLILRVGYGLYLYKHMVPKREQAQPNGISKIAQCALMRVGWTYH